MCSLQHGPAKGDDIYNYFMQIGYYTAASLQEHLWLTQRDGFRCLRQLLVGMSCFLKSGRCVAFTMANACVLFVEGWFCICADLCQCHLTRRRSREFASISNDIVDMFVGMAFTTAM